LARIISNGEVRIYWATTIADPSAPTVAEITAGTDVTGFISSVDTPLDGDAVDASDLSSAFNKTVAGKFGGNVNATMYRDDTADTAFDLFPRNTTGYLVIRRFGGSTTAIAVANDVDVWNLRVITRSDVALDDNTVQAFTTAFAALDEPDIDVAVV
jgi:hypothetical protein